MAAGAGKEHYRRHRFSGHPYDSHSSCCRLGSLDLRRQSSSWVSSLDPRDWTEPHFGAFASPEQSEWSGESVRALPHLPISKCFHHQLVQQLLHFPNRSVPLFRLALWTCLLPLSRVLDDSQEEESIPSFRRRTFAHGRNRGWNLRLVPNFRHVD